MKIITSNALWRLALVAIAVTSLSGIAQSAPPDCAESCLLGIAGSYMDSMAAHDPAGAPFGPAVRTTENGVVTPTTEGIWKTAQGWYYRHTFADPVTGEVGAFGTVSEGEGGDALISLRLKVVGRRIVESELLVARAGDFSLFEPRAAREPNAIFATFAPPERRSSRAALDAIARNYFEAIVSGNPDLVAVHPDANRLENGVRTTNNPGRMPTSVSEGLRRLVYMQRFRELRIPVIDAERGLVWAIVAFDMPEMTRTLMVRGKPVEINPQRQHLPRTLFLYELFKVEDGQIRSIEAVMRNMPLGAGMGWAASAK